MSNYSVVATWGTKDALATGTALKTVSATELGTEFAAIAAMSTTKEDKTNKGIASGYAALDGSALLLAANIPAFTGNVTSPGGSLALTIANSAVTNAKMANMAQNTIKGNNAALGAPLDLTAAQAASVIASGSGGGSTNFLRADGTWAAPAGTGGGFSSSTIKAADTTRTVLTTLNDPDLVTGTLATGTYAFEIFLWINGNSGPGISTALNTTGTIALLGGLINEAFNNTASFSNLGSTNSLMPFSTSNGAAGNYGGGLIIRGTINVTVAGTFGFGWGAHTAGTTIVMAGSFMRLSKIT